MRRPRRQAASSATSLPTGCASSAVPSRATAPRTPAPTGWTPELAPEFSEVDRARREGYEAGQREATERMVDLERQRLHHLATSVGDTARKIEAERFHAVSVAEQDVVDFALQLAEAIIGRELELSATPWREAIRRCALLAPPETEITLRLNPQDAAVGQRRRGAR